MSCDDDSKDVLDGIASLQLALSRVPDLNELQTPAGLPTSPLPSLLPSLSSLSFAPTVYRQPPHQGQAGCKRERSASLQQLENLNQQQHYLDHHSQKSSRHHGYYGSSQSPTPLPPVAETATDPSTTAKEMAALQAAATMTPVRWRGVGDSDSLSFLLTDGISPTASTSIRRTGATTTVASHAGDDDEGQQQHQTRPADESLPSTTCSSQLLPTYSSSTHSEVLSTHDSPVLGMGTRAAASSSASIRIASQSASTPSFSITVSHSSDNFNSQAAASPPSHLVPTTATGDGGDSDWGAAASRIKAALTFLQEVGASSQSDEGGLKPSQLARAS